MALTGDPDRAPVRISVPQSFLHAGSQAAAAALLALLERARSGKGQHVDISAQLTCTQATQSSVLNHLVGAPLVSRAGGGIKAGEIFLRFVYPAKDGYVSVTHVFGAAVGPYSRRLMEWVHEAGYCDEATRDKDWVDYAMMLSNGQESLADFERVKDCVAAFTSTRTKAELKAGAHGRRLLVAPIATTADVLASEQMAAREYWQVDEDGVQFPGAWAKASLTPLKQLRRAPRLGEHSDAVLSAPPRRPSVPPAARSVREGPGAGRAAGHGRGDGSAGGADPDALPLAGVKILDFMWAVAGPTTTRVMADYGATVVRVESSGRIDAARAFQPFFGDKVGTENSALFNSLNAGKLGITLDLSKPEARDVVLDLVRWADVVCEAFSPRAMTAWGLGYDRLREVNAGVIMMSTCLFGQTGPLANVAGYGNLAAAATGFYEVTGWADREPAGPFAAYTDYVAPQFQLAVLLAALEHRRRTGQGQYLDVAQAEAALHFLGPAIALCSADGTVISRRGNDDSELSPHAVYPAAGKDRWVAVACQDDRAWVELAGLLQRPDLADLMAADRRARAAEIDGLVGEWTAVHTAGEVELLLQAAGVAAHQVQNSTELAVDPQVQHAGYWVTVPHPIHGPTVIEGSRYALSRTPARPSRAAPMLGEHVEEVLVGLLGYDEDRLAELAVAEVFD
jgi:crotonobetainyl-CoA:carnitine CoA-transferase CaiB-like acyl-CoA transferase